VVRLEKVKYKATRIMFIKSIIQRLCEQILELISSASSSFYTSSNESSLLNYPNYDDRNNDNEGDADNDDNDKKQFRQWNARRCNEMMHIQEKVEHM
jgi:hypothetical protein